MVTRISLTERSAGRYVCLGGQRLLGPTSTANWKNTRHEYGIRSFQHIGFPFLTSWISMIYNSFSCHLIFVGNASYNYKLRLSAYHAPELVLADNSSSGSLGWVTSACRIQKWFNVNSPFLLQFARKWKSNRSTSFHCVAWRLHPRWIVLDLHILGNVSMDDRQW